MTFWHIRFSRAAAMAVVVITLGAAAGCSGVSSAASGPPPEKADITVGDFPTIDSAGLYIAQMDGLFRAQGLNVTITFTQSSQQAVDGSESGRYDISSADSVTYIDSELLGHDRLRIIGEASELQPGVLELLTSPGSGISTVSQLAGRSVGVTAPDDIATLLIDSLLADNGLSGSAVHFKPGIELPDAPADVHSGAVAAAPVPEPFVSQGEQQYGLPEIADLDQGSTSGFPIQDYAVTAAWAEKYPSTLAAFQRALAQGQEIADTDRTAVEQAVEKFLHVPAQTAAIIALPDFPTAASPEQLQRVLAAMIQFGFLPVSDKSFSMSSMTG
jgi:NitT/TauT family transport system substrate-binding protein